MSPIDQISDIRRFPLLGKIRLGVKKESQRSGGSPYPQAVDFFVCPPEVQEVYGEKPTELKVMFPSDDLELVAPQYYKCYSYSQGLICKGNGKTCRRKIDVNTGDFASKETRQWELTDSNCEPDSCHLLASKQCRKVMSLYFILPDVPGLGVYQLNTSSFYSIVNLNSQLAPRDGFLRQFTTNGRIAFIPLILSIKPQEVFPPGEGRKTVHVLSVRADAKLADIIRISRQRPAQVLLPVADEEEPPDDLFPGELLAEAEVIVDQDQGAEPAPLAIEGPLPADVPAPKAKTKRAAATPPAAVRPIELDWLRESLETLHWSETTFKSWLVSKFPGLDTEGELADVLSRLNKEQAQLVTDELNARTGDRQPGLL